MTKKFTVTLEQIPEITEYLYELLPTYKIFTFNGPLGAGKTTIIRALLKKCGIEETITSPTFNYVNVYENRFHQLFYHFDLYRITSMDQFTQAGFDELFHIPNSWVFIEWPEIIEPLLPQNRCEIFIDYANNGREITVVQK